MVVKHCVYKDCESDSRYWDRDYMKGVCFIRFPNPVTHRERCEKWVKACDRPLELTIDCVTDKTYICSKHFLGGNGPTKQSADPLPLKQLLAANQLSNASQSYDTTPEAEERNGFLRADLNCIQNTNESQYITNILNTNHSYIRENHLSSTQSVANNRNIMNTSCAMVNDHKVVDIDSSDNSIDFNNESIADSLLMPTMTTNVSQMTPQLVPQNADNHNTSHHKPQEVINNSLPLIIIPSANQMISSTFSVPFMSINDEKSWFARILDNEFCAKASLRGLSVGRVGRQRLALSAIRGSVVEKQLIVDASGHFDCKVFGQSISAKNGFYGQVPALVANEREFNAVIELFGKWRVCAANEVTDGRVFEDKVIAIRAFVCNITNSIRSRNCDLFLPDLGAIRCKSCRILLNRIRKFRANTSAQSVVQ